MNKPFIIAEVGINHNGNIEIAKKLIDMAKESGCDAVKFQKRDIETVYTKEFLSSPRESPWGHAQWDQKNGLELNAAAYDELDRYCHSMGMPWFASAWDEKSQKFLREYKLPYNKIASACLTHDLLTDIIASEGKYTFISTGGSTFQQIDAVVNKFDKVGTPFCLLHCVSVYPCDDDKCNLLMIKTLQQRYGHSVGYSGHERGVLPSILAVSLGAEVIERHITLDRTMYGSDQSASLERHGLELLVRDCRDLYKMLGTGVKQEYAKEDEVIGKLRYWSE